MKSRKTKSLGNSSNNGSMNLRAEVSLRTKILWFIAALVVTTLITRLWLWFSPSTNLDIAGYNIHHLYTGAFLLVIVVVLLLFEFVDKYTIILAGISSSLILDELVYLIATDGSDAAYLGSTSFLGMIITITIILVITGGIYYANTQTTR